MDRAAVAALAREEPQFAALVEFAHTRVGHVLELAFDKVVAHLDDPRRHPLPADGRALDCVLHRFVARESDGAKRRLARKLADRLAPAARRQRYGDLAEVDLASSSPVLDLARPRIATGCARPRPPERKRIAARIAALAKPTPRAVAATRITLGLQSIRCIQETREILEGADEMTLFAGTFDAEDVVRNRTAATLTVDLGRMRRDDVRTLDGEVGGLFLTPGDALPAGFGAILVATEKDRFAADDSGLDAAVLGVLLAFTTASAATSIVGIVLTVVLSLASTVLTGFLIAAGLLFGLGFTAALVVGRRFGDDRFEPEVVLVEVASPADAFAPETVRLRNGLNVNGTRKVGEYELTYQWRLS